jgi:non-ribosomal peptide synthetase component F
LIGIPIDETLLFTFEYCTKLFKKETVEKFAGYLKKIIVSVLNKMEIKLAEIEIISGEEKKKILFDFNATTRKYPKDKSIHQLFAEQVERTPDQIALVAHSAGRKAQGEGRGAQGAERKAHSREDRHAPCAMRCALSYKELNKKSQRLACRLNQKGVKPETIVGIKVKRSIEMITGLLGILKAGGAYLPIDPDYPAERINYMLADSNAEILLTTSEIIKAVGKIDSPASQLPSFPASNSSNLCYIIYTSGSTGRPKGYWSGIRA